jgi:excisionase family DNA binding protein|tara:strand:+ start:387 stop:548 length:162 start_codon:yes stop_codon:yes gene_type:complete
MTIKDAAKFLEVKPCTVRRYIKARLFPVVRLTPRTLRINRGDLEAFKRKKTTT